MPVNPADRPRWVPPVPRIPDSVMRLFPEGKPPKQSRTTAVDWVSYALILVTFAMGAYWLTLAITGFALWRSVLAVVHEQQLTDWINRKPDDKDIPPEER